MSENLEFKASFNSFNPVSIVSRRSSSF